MSLSFILLSACISLAVLLVCCQTKQTPCRLWVFVRNFAASVASLFHLHARFACKVSLKANWQSTASSGWQASIAHADLIRLIAANPDLFVRIPPCKSSNTPLFARLVNDNNLIYASASRISHHAKLWAPAFRKKWPAEIFLHAGRRLLANISPSADFIDTAERYTVDVLGHALLGIDFHATTVPESEIATELRTMLSARTASDWPSILRLLESSWLPFTSRSRCLLQWDTFLRTIIRARRAGIEFGNLVYGADKDIASLVLRATADTADAADGMLRLKCYVSEQDLVDNLNAVFYVAFTTLSHNITAAFQVLARHQDMQRHVRNQVLAILGQQQTLTEEHLAQMTFIDKIIQESAIFGIAPVWNRLVAKDLTLPGTNVCLEKGTRVRVNVAKTLRPEGASPETCKIQNSEIAKVVMARSELSYGNRCCVGINFVPMHVKALLVLYLMQYEWTEGESGGGAALEFKRI